MNKFSREDDSVLVCRTRNGSGDEVKIDFYPLSPSEIFIYVTTDRGTKFDKAEHTYQIQMR